MRPTFLYQPRRSYDTSVKHLVRLGCESMIQPELFQTIPKTNISRWRREKEDKYVGFELNGIAQEKLELIQQFAEAKNFQRVFIAYGRLQHIFKSVVTSASNFKQTVRKSREKIVEVVQRVSPVIGVKNAIRVFGISRSTYQHWLIETLVKCDESLLALCRRRYPSQLLPNEVKAMKHLLTDPDLAHWPIISVAHYAMRTKVVSASISSWYKYAKLLQIRRLKAKNRSNKYKQGLIASEPNQYWHADITVFKTLDGCKHYIYLVVDNFSRKILSWRVSKQVSGSIRMQTLREAWEVAQKHQPQNLKVDLIVDGGPENVNSIVDNFINTKGINIHKSIALKDILFSNSLVEAANKILKYRYLYLRPVEDFAALVKAVDLAVHDFNALRPHGKLSGYTPDEMYSSASSGLPDYSAHIAEARVNRRLRNQENQCDSCF